MSEQDQTDQPRQESNPASAHMGLAEASMASMLNTEWPALSIDLTGPDATETIGRVVFYSCPVCHSVVAPPTEDSHFPQMHAERHIKEARDWDSINDLFQRLMSLDIEPLLKIAEEQKESAADVG